MESRRTESDLAALLRHDTAPWRLARPVVLALVLVVGAGSLLGILAYHLTGGGQGWPTTVARTANGWRVGSPSGLLQQSGLSLTDHYLAWDNGGCLELLDLRSGETKVLEYPPADGTGGVWAVISERYVAWQSNDVSAGGTRIVAYDLKTRRRFAVADTGDLGGTIALSGPTLFWDCDTSTATDPSRGQIRARDLATGRGFTVADGDIQLGDVSGDLVMWSQSQGKPASDQLTVVKDLASGRTWRLRLCPKGCQTNACSLSGRTLVWDVERDIGGDVRRQDRGARPRHRDTARRRSRARLAVDRPRRAHRVERQGRRLLHGARHRWHGPAPARRPSLQRHAGGEHDHAGRRGRYAGPCRGHEDRAVSRLASPGKVIVVDGTSADEAAAVVDGTSADGAAAAPARLAKTGEGLVFSYRCPLHGEWHTVPYGPAFARRYVAAAGDGACCCPGRAPWSVRRGLARTRLLAWLLAIVWLANLCDLVLTLRALSQGRATEANRLMAVVLQGGSLGAALIKVGGVTLGVVLLWLLRRRGIVLPATAVLALAFVALVVYEALSLAGG